MKSSLSHKIWCDTRDLLDLSMKGKEQEESQVRQCLATKNIECLEDFDSAMISFLKHVYPQGQFKVWSQWPKAQRWSNDEVIISLDHQLQGNALWIESGKGINFFLILELYHQRWQRVQEWKKPLPPSSEQSFEKFIESFPLACVVVEKSGEFVAQNRKFSEAFKNVNDFLSMAKDQDVVQSQELYQVNQVSSSHLIMYFLIPLTQENIAQKTTGAEAGIICGSLAHELNNPLSAILLSLESLLWGPELSPIRFELLDLVKNAQRARDLVRIFLGFSKYDHPLSAKCDWQVMAGTALELLRGRFIEGEVGLHLKWQSLGNKDQLGHPSYVAMLFFLLFDEILTQVSHFNLIRGKESNRSKWIDVEIIQTQSNVMIQFPHNNLYFIPSKTNHLLVFILHSLQLEMNAQGAQLSLTAKGGNEGIFGKEGFFQGNQSSPDESHQVF